MRRVADAGATMAAIEYTHEALLHQVDDEVDDTLLVEALATIAAIAAASLVLVPVMCVPVMCVLVMWVPVMRVPVMRVPVAFVPVPVGPGTFVPVLFLFAFERREATLDPAQLFENALEYFAFHRASGSSDAARRGAARAQERNTEFSSPRAVRGAPTRAERILARCWISLHGCSPSSAM